MSTYCDVGQEPTVYYSFNNAKEKKYKSKIAPISVEIVDAIGDDGSENYNREGFKLTVTALDGYVWIDGVVKDYIANVGADYTTFSIIPCGSSDWQGIATLSTGQTITNINTNIKCPIVTDTCVIRIKHNGVIIFQDKGKKDCSFKVECGNCPDGFIECPHPGYPGYCCIDCKGSAAKINTLAQTVEQYGRTM